MNTRDWRMMMLVGLVLPLVFGLASLLRGEYKSQSPEARDGYCAVITFSCRVTDAKREAEIKAAFIDAAVKARDGGLNFQIAKWHCEKLASDHPTQRGLTLMGGTLIVAKPTSAESIAGSLPHMAALLGLPDIQFAGTQVRLVKELSGESPGRGTVLTLPRSK